MKRSIDPLKRIRQLQKEVDAFERRIKTAPVEQRPMLKLWVRQKRKQLNNLEQKFKKSK